MICLWSESIKGDEKGRNGEEVHLLIRNMHLDQISSA